MPEADRGARIARRAADLPREPPPAGPADGPGHLKAPEDTVTEMSSGYFKCLGATGLRVEKLSRRRDNLAQAAP